MTRLIKTDRVSGFFAAIKEVREEHQKKSWYLSKGLKYIPLSPGQVPTLEDRSPAQKTVLSSSANKFGRARLILGRSLDV